MAVEKNVHTVPTGDGWADRREGGKRAFSTHNTKAEAEAAGRAAAKERWCRTSDPQEGRHDRGPQLLR